MNPSWQPPADSGMTIRRVATNGLSFEVIEAGAGHHLALCLHGYPELAFSWRHQIPMLAEMGYRVWAPNQRGYGASSRPEGVEAYRLDRLVADVAALFDASGARTLTLIGHDRGGTVAWSFAIQRVRAIERLVVMNMPHPRCFARAALLAAAAAQLVPAGVPDARAARTDAAAPRWRGAPADLRAARGRSGKVPGRGDVCVAAALRPGALTAMLNWYRAIPLNPHPRWLPNAGTVAAPTLVVWGDEDSTLGVGTLNGIGEFVADLTIRRLPRGVALGAAGSGGTGERHPARMAAGRALTQARHRRGKGWSLSAPPFSPRTKRNWCGRSPESSLGDRNPSSAHQKCATMPSVGRKLLVQP